MIAISWDDSYSVHVESIDKQHKKIMRLINDLNRIKSDDTDKLETALSSLSDYTREHFEYEESFLEKFHYPFYETHREKHDSFLKTIDQAQREIRHSHTAYRSKVINTLVFWLKNHIIKEDKQYSCFMLEHGVK